MKRECVDVILRFINILEIILHTTQLFQQSNAGLTKFIEIKSSIPYQPKYQETS